MGSFILKTFLQFLFLITPFFVLSMFLSMTQGWETAAKKKLAVKVGVSAFVTCVFLLFFGRWLFAAFDITIDAFRIGGGALLFLSAVGLVNSKIADKAPSEDMDSEVSNIAVVPLAIPVTCGPGTIAAVLVIGAESGSFTNQLACVVGLVCAFAILTTMLVLSAWVEQKLGRNVIIILSKITGLILSAMAAQLVFTGIKHILAI
ncbi:MAG: NAAT family transporter [Lentisphaeria bacterium]|nr:NAAT family transporter [Lentisphaeria bacterium]